MLVIAVSFNDSYSHATSVYESCSIFMLLVKPNARPFALRQVDHAHSRVSCAVLF